MKKHAFPLWPALIVVALFVLFSWRGASCAPDVEGNPGDIVIRGRDHATLRADFSGMEEGRAARPLSKKSVEALFRAVPDSSKNACEEQVNGLGKGAAGTAGMTIDGLYVEAGKEGGPTRALLAIVCASKNDAFAGAFREERPAALVISRGSSRLSLLTPDRSGRKGPRFVRIAVEKEMRINGRAVVGLDVVRSYDDSSGGGAVGLLKDERVQFYVFGDEGIKPAGSVLKEREERLRDGDGKAARSVYKAGVVLKKDMKGNIVGILSPYTLEKDSSREGKGMVRYGWDEGMQMFVKEKE